MNEDTLRVVLCTCPPHAAATMARTLVTEKLVACVNIVPGVTSIYRWEGALEEDKEALLIMKTTASGVPDLQERLLALHPYDVPEVLALSVSEGSEAYIAWVKESLRTG